MRAPNRLWAAAIVVTGVVATVGADVLEIRSEIRSEVRSFVSGEFHSSDLAIENFGETGLELPIQTVARLETIDDADRLIARAVGVADFRDPALSVLPNPEEFGLEADCFSNDGVTSYEVTSTAVETRSIVLGAAALANPGGDPQTVSSNVFLSGAIFVWTNDPDRDLTGLSAELVMVVRQRFDDGRDLEVYNERVEVRGGPNGSVQIGGTPDVLALLFEVQELPDPIVQAFPGEAIGDLGSFDRAHVVLIPFQPREYRYEALVDEAFELEATFETHVVNLPGGTGAGAVFGRSFEVLAEVIRDGRPSTEPLAVQARINHALAKFNREAQSVRGSPILPEICGVFGFEAFAMMVLSPFLCIVPRPRGSRRSPDQVL